MKFIITDATACSIELGAFNHYKHDGCVHITIEGNKQHFNQDTIAPLDTINFEFGRHSKNYALTFQFDAPKNFEESLKTGTGNTPIQTFVYPYLVENNKQNKFTTVRENASIGGIFVDRENLNMVLNYIRDRFPEATITDETSKQPILHPRR